MSYPLVQELLFWDKDMEITWCVLCMTRGWTRWSSKVPSNSVDSMKYLRVCKTFFSEFSLTLFAPSFISSQGLTFHSMLYSSLPDLILFPGIPYVIFMFQWLRNKWESGQSFEGSSLHSALLLSWTQQRFVSLGNLELLWECRAVSVSHTEKGACSVLWDVAVGAWKTVVSSGRCQHWLLWGYFQWRSCIPKNWALAESRCW